MIVWLYLYCTERNVYPCILDGSVSQNIYGCVYIYICVCIYIYKLYIYIYIFIYICINIYLFTIYGAPRPLKPISYLAAQCLSLWFSFPLCLRFLHQSKGNGLWVGKNRDIVPYRQYEFPRGWSMVRYTDLVITRTLIDITRKDITITPRK